MPTAQELINASGKKKNKIINPYTQAREVARDYNREREYKKNLAIKDYEEEQRRRKQSVAGRMSAGFSKATSFIKKGGATSYFYGQQNLKAPQGYTQTANINKSGQTISGIKSGRRGRPVGTKDVRYAAYGGVHGYRKAMAHKRALEKMQFQRQANLSPEEQSYLRQVQSQREASSMNPERRTIPDSYGTIPLKGIMDEIDAASHIFD